MKASILISTPTPKTVEMLSYFIYEGETLPHTPSTERLQREAFTGATGEMVIIENHDGYEYVAYVGLGKKKAVTGLVVKNTVATLVRAAEQRQLKTLAVVLPNELQTIEYGEQSSMGVHLGSYLFLRYKTDEKTKKRVRLQSVQFVVDAKTQFEQGLTQGTLVAEGVILARDLVNDPASNTTTQTLVDEANKIAQACPSITVKVLEEQDCAKLGMGSYLSVAKGSVVPPKFVVLKYRPSKSKPKKTVALVGKSIMFDSGGLSLKPSEAMEDMKIDMSGGATVLGTFLALANLSKLGHEVPHTVYGILPACENMPSGSATRPGDIVTAMNGKTIEVLNTDAEGRLTLADALVYAERECGAEIVIDLATLTGACMVALGTDLTGMFTNNTELGKMFQTVADTEGDELWWMPLYAPYAKKMKSDIADLKNIGGGRYGGAITAAVFLEEFVDKAHWIHCDIAGPAYRNEEPKGVWGKGATGWGVQSLVRLLFQVS